MRRSKTQIARQYALSTIKNLDIISLAIMLLLTIALISGQLSEESFIGIIKPIIGVLFGNIASKRAR